MKKIALLALLAPIPSFAGIVLNLDFGYFLQANNTAVPNGSLLVLVADTTGNGFTGSTGATSAALGGETLATGNFFGTDDLILGSVSTYAPKYDGSTLGTAPLTTGYNGSVSFNLSGNLGVGDNLAIYFFPGITSTSQSLDGQKYGFWSGVTPTAIPQASEISFQVPADNFSYGLGAFSPQSLIEQGGSTDTNLDPTQANFTAGLTVPPAVPEPSTYALAFGAIALLFASRRRK